MIAARGQATRRRVLRLSLVAAVSVAAVFVMILTGSGLFADEVRMRADDDRRVPFAVLGDSDSHGYRDDLAFGPGRGLRGGAFAAITSQWTEVLQELRADAVDLGDFGVWGGRTKVVALMETLGLERRAPRKRDHQFNLAFSGASCGDLMTGVRRQVPRLLRLMARQPERWARGVVVVRIGIVDLGGAAALEAMAQDPDTPAVVQRIDDCVAAITAAVAAISAQHPQTRVVLVGLFDNRNVPEFRDRWRTALQTANITRALDRFDDGLRAIAAGSPRYAFFDDRAWFRSLWGGRDGEGTPRHTVVEVGGLRVEHGCGDEPHHTALADGHAGLVVNTLWAGSLSRLLHDELGLPVPPITDAEVETFVKGRYAAR